MTDAEPVRLAHFSELSSTLVSFGSTIAEHVLTRLNAEEREQLDPSVVIAEYRRRVQYALSNVGIKLDDETLVIAPADLEYFRRDAQENGVTLEQEACAMAALLVVGVFIRDVTKPMLDTLVENYQLYGRHRRNTMPG